MFSDKGEGISRADRGRSGGHETEHISFLPKGFARPCGFDFKPRGGGDLADAIVGAGGLIEDKFDFDAGGDGLVGDVQARIGEGGGDEGEEEEEMFHGDDGFQLDITFSEAKDVFFSWVNFETPRRKVRQGLRSVWILGMDRVGRWGHREGHGWDFGLAWFWGDLLIAMPKVSVEVDHGVVKIENGCAA